MDENLLSTKCLKIYFAVIFIILFMTLFVYAVRVQAVPLPSNNLLSDFGTYFSGVLIPFLTIFSVFALVITLRYQREQLQSQQLQFELQQKAIFYESYIQRFEIQYERYLSLCKIEFPCHPATNKKFRFNLYEYRQLSSITNKYIQANQSIKTIEEIRDEPLKDFKHVDITRRIRFYIDDVRLEAESATHSLIASYAFAQPENIFILKDLWQRAFSMISDLHLWKIISDEKFNKLKNDIDIPLNLTDI